MAQADVYVMEAANLICGSVGGKSSPGESTHLSILELKLPGLEKAYLDIMAGGAPVSIETSTHYNKLESTFNLAGWQPKVQGLLGKFGQPYLNYTAYGLIRNKRTNTPQQATAIMWGELSRMNPTAFRKGDLMHHEYAIRSIVHYELYMPEGGDPLSGGIEGPTQGTNGEIIYWDHFSSEFRINGQDVNADYVNLLNIPGITSATGAAT
jgi:phage tail tube protein FII